MYYNRNCVRLKKINSKRALGTHQDDHRHSGLVRKPEDDGDNTERVNHGLRHDNEL